MGKRLWLQQYAISYADIDTYYAIKRRIIELASAALSQRANKGQNMARGRGKMHVRGRNAVFTNMQLLTLHMQFRGVLLNCPHCQFWHQQRYHSGQIKARIWLEGGGQCTTLAKLREAFQFISIIALCDGGVEPALKENC